MAERKKLPPIKSRDLSYIAQLRGIDSKHQSSFRIRERAVEAAGSGVETPVAAGPAQTLPAKARQKREPAGAEKEAARAPSPPGAIMSEPGKLVALKIYFGVAPELVARATPWAERARTTPQRIALAALKEIRPALLAKLPDVRQEEISHARMPRNGLVVNTTWSIDAGLHEQLRLELDPEGFNNLSVMLSRWVREEFARGLDAYLARAGY